MQKLSLYQKTKSSRSQIICDDYFSNFDYRWLIMEEKINPNSASFDQDILKEYISDAFAFLQKEISVLKNIDQDFSYEQEKRLKSIFDSLISARRVYQEEYSSKK